MSGKYQDRRQKERERKGVASSAGRDIGAIPAIGNIDRREACRDSLRLFCETYAAAAFTLEWSADHLKVIARIEEAVRHGALYAFAMPRGSGKTTICRLAALWALSYAHRQYVFVIGANHGKAEDTVNAIQLNVRFLADYADDFPEISVPAHKLGGIANRAKGQLCQGQSTLIEWSKDRLILPTVPPPKRWPKHWPLRSDGMVPTSGLVLSASGLTADGIRGSALTLSTGAVIRPDFVLLDDPQTPESASSPSQCATREQLVSADVLGMAGPDKTISAVMPCTVIKPGDMVDVLLDREKHPMWRGERTRLLESMPSDLGAWDSYFEVYRRDALREPPDFSASTDYYLGHRDLLEAGAVASWQARKLDTDVSAVQYAMHLFYRDRTAFWSEYQNEPQRLQTSDVQQLVAADLARRLNRHGRGLVPTTATTLTAMIDVHAELLYWMVCAWGPGFSGDVIDYGTFPDQRRGYFRASEARPTLGQAVGVASVEGAIWAGLDRLTNQILGREWRLDGGGALRISRLLIDSGWQTELIYRFTRQTPFAAIALASKGVAISAKTAPMGEWKRSPGERHGTETPWILRPPAQGRPRLLVFDANWWKTFVAARMSQALGGRGTLTFFGEDADEHRLLCDHLCAEFRVQTEGRGRQLEEWQHRPERPDNHWLDTAVGCAVAASIEGCALSGAGQDVTPRAAPRERWSDMQKRKQQERKRDQREW
jgi:hypothetical protein